MYWRFLFLWSVLATGNHSFSQAPPGKMVEIVLDASGSMAGKLESGVLKMDAAKTAVSELVGKLSVGTSVAFRAYGHQSAKEKRDCTDTQWMVPFGPASQNKNKIVFLLPSLQPKGYTPITYVLNKAAEDFPKNDSADKVILLISDGQETCEGDPCATAKALAKKNSRLMIHTIGFGANEVARSQLECIARAARGSYFTAETAAQLSDALNQAVAGGPRKEEEKKGDGRLEIKRADYNGHTVTDAETGALKAKIDALHAVRMLPAGLYHVSFGSSVWKSVEVRAGETTILLPAVLKVAHASLRGHEVIDPETGAIQGNVSAAKSFLTLMPGRYEVLFGSVPWAIELKGGQETELHPGTVTVKRAHYSGHTIRNALGQEVGSVSSTTSTIPLPPGDYTIEIAKTRILFSLKEGDQKEFENR